MLQNKSLVAKNRRRYSREWASERSKNRHSFNDPDGDACVRSCWFVRFFPSKHCRIAYRVTNFSALAARVLSLGWGCGSGDLRGAPHRRFSPTFRWTRRELGNDSWQNLPVLGFIETDFSNQIVVASGFSKYYKVFIIKFLYYFVQLQTQMISQMSSNRVCHFTECIHTFANAQQNSSTCSPMLLHFLDMSAAESLRLLKYIQILELMILEFPQDYLNYSPVPNQRISLWADMTTC